MATLSYVLNMRNHTSSFNCKAESNTQPKSMPISINLRMNDHSSCNELIYPLELKTFRFTFLTAESQIVNTQNYLLGKLLVVAQYNPQSSLSYINERRCS